MSTRNFHIYWREPSDPSQGLEFVPPQGSDELYEALKEYYPHLKNLQSRMQAAVIEFYVEQSSNEIDATAPYESPVQFESPAQMSVEDLLTSPMSNSFSSSLLSTPSMQMATPMTNPIQPASPSSSVSVPKQEELMSVFTLTSNSSAKIHKRRNMTEAEKVAYKAKRLVGACVDCKRRRRKCTHNTSGTPSQSSTTLRSSKQSKRLTSTSKYTPPTPSSDLVNIDALDLINFDLSFDSADFTPDFTPAQDLSEDFFTKDFPLFDTSSWVFNNNYLPHLSSHQQINHLSSSEAGKFDLEQYIDYNGGNSNNGMLHSNHLFDTTDTATGYAASPAKVQSHINIQKSPKSSKKIQRKLQKNAQSNIQTQVNLEALFNHASNDYQYAFDIATVGSPSMTRSAARSSNAPAVEPTVSRSGVFTTTRNTVNAHQDATKTSASLDYTDRRQTSQAPQQVNDCSTNIYNARERFVSSWLQSTPSSSQSFRGGVPTATPMSPVGDSHTTITLSASAHSKACRLCPIFPSLTESLATHVASTSSMNALMHNPASNVEQTHYAGFTSLMLLITLLISSLYGHRGNKDVKGTVTSNFLSSALQFFTLLSLAFPVPTMRQSLTSLVKRMLLNSSNFLRKDYIFTQQQAINCSQDSLPVVLVL